MNQLMAEIAVGARSTSAWHDIGNGSSSYCHHCRNDLANCPFWQRLRDANVPSDSTLERLRVKIQALATAVTQMLASDEALRGMLDAMNITVSEALQTRSVAEARGLNPVHLIGSCTQAACATIAADIAHRLSVRCIECKLHSRTVDFLEEATAART